MKAALDEQAWRLVRALAQGRTILAARARRLLKAREKQAWWPVTKRCR